MRSAVFGVAALLLSSSTNARAVETLEVTFDTTGPHQIAFKCFDTTSTPTGSTDDRHLMVVWIEDPSGNYMKTLRRWGHDFVYNLEAWADASGMAMDGVTLATPDT